MYRNVINDFASWFEDKKRQLLYIKGAYGVGKTWAIKDFATGFFESYRYIDLTTDEKIKELVTLSSFSNELKAYQSRTDYPLDNPDFKEAVREEIYKLDMYLCNIYGEEDYRNVLLIFDNAESVANSDIFFHEYSRIHPHYSVCVVASTMETTPYQYHYKDVFRIIRMRPMTFEEYLIAKKSHPLIAAISNNKQAPLNPFEENSIHTLLKEYMMIGGMPEIVKTYIKTKSFEHIRSIQLDILKQYKKKIRETLSNAMSSRCMRIWKSLPAQLEKDNKKFMYNNSDPNARAREYSEAAQALCDLGFARKLPRLKSATLPLEDNADYKSFELFLIDHGLLRALYDLPIDENLSLLDIFQEKNGAVAEQYIFQELSSKLGYLYYWVSGAKARVPFVYESDRAPIPVDIQFVPKKKSQNIRVFFEKNSSKTSSESSQEKNTDISLKISLDQVFLDVSSSNKSVLNVPAYSLWTLI